PSLDFFHVVPASTLYTLSLPDALPIFHARALDEEPHVRGFRAERSGERRGERRRVGEPLAPRPEALHRPRRERTGRVEPLEAVRSEEHTSELQSLRQLVCRLLLEKKK